MILFVSLLACIILDESEHKEYLAELEKMIPSSHYVNYNYDDSCITINGDSSKIVPIYTDEWLYSFVLATELIPSGVGKPLILVSQGLDRIIVRKSTEIDRLVLEFCTEMSCQEDNLSLAVTWNTFQKGDRITLRFQNNTLTLYRNSKDIAELTELESPLFRSSMLNNNLGIGCVDVIAGFGLTEGSVWFGGIDDLIIAGKEDNAMYAIWEEIVAERPVWIAYLEEQNIEENIYYWPLGEEIMSTAGETQVEELLNGSHGEARNIQFLAYE